jgi:hypothetical protein
MRMTLSSVRTLTQLHVLKYLLSNSDNERVEGLPVIKYKIRLPSALYIGRDPDTDTNTDRQRYNDHRENRSDEAAH